MQKIVLNKWERRDSIFRINQALKVVKKSYSTLIQKLLQESRFQSPTKEELYFLRHSEEAVIYLRWLKKQVSQNSLEALPSQVQIILEFKRK